MCKATACTYIVSGHENNTAVGGQLLAGPGNKSAALGNLLYDGQNFFNGGLLATWQGITANVDVTYGREDGSNALVTRGGAPMAAELFGLSYFWGPWSVGANAAIIDSQGTEVQLTHTSQRHEFATAVGGAYRIAPGIVIFALNIGMKAEASREWRLRLGYQRHRPGWQRHPHAGARVRDHRELVSFSALQTDKTAGATPPSLSEALGVQSSRKLNAEALVQFGSRPASGIRDDHFITLPATGFETIFFARQGIAMA